MSTEIVRRALQLAQEHPTWPRQQVLDAAMDQYVGTSPEFDAEPNAEGFSDSLHPPSPFAQLLMDAFGEHLRPEEFDAESSRWHQIIEAFAARYRLWQ